MALQLGDHVVLVQTICGIVTGCSQEIRRLLKDRMRTQATSKLRGKDPSPAFSIRDHAYLRSSLP